MGHGDFFMIVYAPNTVQEMADMVFTAFDKADEYLTPVMILADGLLGQMMEPVELPDEVTDLPEKPWATDGHKNKRPHNIANSLYLQSNELEAKLLERAKRYEVIIDKEQQSEGFMLDDAEIVLVSFGASSRISRSAVVAAREEGIKAGLLRPITLWPFPGRALEATMGTAKAYLSVEMNMGQMIDDIRLVVGKDVPSEHFGRTGGIVPTPAEVLDAIRALHAKVGE